MPHDLLDQFQVSFVLTQPGTECVPKLVDAESRDGQRLSIFGLGGLSFLLVVVADDPGNGTVYAVRTKHTAETVLPYKPAVSVNYSFAESSFLLPFVLGLKGVSDALEHWDHPNPVAGLWCGDVELHLAAVLQAVYQVVVLDWSVIIHPVENCEPALNSTSNGLREYVVSKLFAIASALHRKDILDEQC